MTTTQGAAPRDQFFPDKEPAPNQTDALPRIDTRRPSTASKVFSPTFRQPIGDEFHSLASAAKNKVLSGLGVISKVTAPPSNPRQPSAQAKATFTAGSESSPNTDEPVTSPKSPAAESSSNSSVSHEDLAKTVERSPPAEAVPTSEPAAAPIARPSVDSRQVPRGQPPAQPTLARRDSVFAENKMHQTSSRLLRMTDDERPFTRDFKDLFATLVVSLPLTPHRYRFQKIDNTFTSEEAINNLGSLKFSQSNRMPDPKDPSRIVTTTTTTTFSMAKEMARSVCQRFLDARFIESADNKNAGLFPLKGALWQLTPKGMHVLQRFCQRNGINQRHVLDLLDSPRNTMQLVVLERDANSDKLSHDRATVEVIFRRFAGQNGPNVKNSTTLSDSDSLNEYYNGLVGVKMAKERKIGDRIVHNTFTGRAAVGWLMDCCTTVDRRETFEVAELFVQNGLIYAALEDQRFINSNLAASSFQPTKDAIYGVTEKGQRVAGWIKSEPEPEPAAPASSASNAAASVPRTSGSRSEKLLPRDSNNNRLMAIVNDPALRLLFKEFLRDTHCEENLAFYLEVREFTSQYDVQEASNAFQRLDTIKENLAAAYGLYNAFLAPGSPCELNIDHNLRNNLAGRMTRAVGDDDSMFKSLQDVVALFREAQTSVFKLMSSDSVPKFLKEPKYSGMLREHNFEAAAAAQAAQSNQQAQQAPTALPERTMSRGGREQRAPPPSPAVF